MSKKKKPVMAAAGYVGEEPAPREEAIKLCRLMTEQGVSAIHITYNGSGDSGEYGHAMIATRNANKKEKDPDVGWEETDIPASDEINAAAWDLIDKEINPDFNNDGSEGYVTIRILKNGKLKMHGLHSDFITTTEDTSIDQILVDPADFV